MPLATIAYFLLAALGFGFVIFIHELGHFLFAKWAGVKVEVFSIGFGPKLIRRQIGETEYALSLLPFGGYVKMLGQDDNPGAEQADPDEPIDPRSFLAATPKWRALILLGGVLFNLLSSYLILICLAFHGMPIIRPLVGKVEQRLTDRSGKEVQSPAERLGLRRGDRVREVDGETVRSFEDLNTEVVINAREPVHLTIRRRGESEDRHLPESGKILPVYQADRGFAVLGLQPPAGDHIHQVLATRTTPANLELGERVVGIDGKPLPSDEPELLCGQEIHERLLPYLGREVELTLEKDGRTRTATIKYAGDANEPVVTGFPVVIESVVAGQPAEKAGVHGGDIILAVGSEADEQLKPAFDLNQCMALLHDYLDHGRPCRIALWRPHDDGSGERLELEIHGETVEGGRHQIGIVARWLGTGRMPPLPTLEDGSQTPLQAAGVHEGDTIVGIVEASDDKAKAGAPKDESAEEAGVTLAVLTGGQRVLVPVPKEALEDADKVKPVPAWARWFGAKPKPSLLKQLLGTRVEPGSLAPGFVRVSPADGSGTRDIDLRDLESKSPGFTAALQPGDWIVGTTPSEKGPTIELLRGAAGSPEPHTYDPGVAFAFDVEEVPYHLSSWREAFTMVDATSYNMVVKTLQLIPRFFRSADEGGINPNKSLTGPVGMFRLLKVKAQQFGMASYLKFLALMGLNLFLVNLLPIPITDGGQLLLLGIETAVRRPLPARVRNLLQWAGFILVVGLMLYVLGLDISRL